MEKWPRLDRVRVGKQIVNLYEGESGRITIAYIHAQKKTHICCRRIDEAHTTHKQIN